MIWHKIHDFFHGWGLLEYIEDNDIILEDHQDELIPWKVVRRKITPRIIWSDDARRYLDIDIFDESIDPLTVYNELSSFEKVNRDLPKIPDFSKITLPKIKNAYPPFHSFIVCGDHSKSR